LLVYLINTCGKNLFAWFFIGAWLALHYCS